jgi:hypothetical protein
MYLLVDNSADIFDGEEGDQFGLIEPFGRFYSSECDLEIYISARAYEIHSRQAFEDH